MCFNNGRLMIDIMRIKEIHVFSINLILKTNIELFKLHYTYIALLLVECSVAKSGSQVSDDPVKTIEKTMIYVQDS